MLEEQEKIILDGLESNSSIRSNSLQVYNFVDLLGYDRRKALIITQRRIQMAQEAIDNDVIKPNYGNRKDHIFKIVAHKGKHSQAHGAVLKHVINQFLQENEYDYYQDMQNGVFLVRL